MICQLLCEQQSVRGVLNAQVLGKGKPVSRDSELMLPCFLIALDLLNILKAFKD